jgi:hypothetical protein
MTRNGLLAPAGAVAELNLVRSKLMRLFFATLLTWMVAACWHAPEQKISENAVLRVMAALDEAESKKDTAALLPHLADEFTITSRSQDGRVRERMNRVEYKTFLTELFTKAADYKHSRGKVTVQVAPDGKTATARYETFQHEERADKGAIDWSDIEADTFVLRDGKVLLRSVETRRQIRNQTPQ